MFDCKVHDRVARLTLSHPPLNALSRSWAQALTAILDELEARDDWQVLHVRSNQRVFSAGGDIKEFAARLAQADAGEILAAEAGLYQQLFQRIEAMPQISLAEIDGAAAGGGFELALACDLRVIAENARVGLPEVGLGLLPSAGGTQRMTRRCGAAVALRLIGTSELISGTEALRVGLAQWTAPSAELPRLAADIATRLAAQPSEALIAAKACIRAALEPGTDGFRQELAAPVRLMSDPETRRRLLAYVERSSERARRT